MPGTKFMQVLTDNVEFFFFFFNDLLIKIQSKVLEIRCTGNKVLKEIC